MLLLKHNRLALENLTLLPTIPWHEKFQQSWQPGEAGAQTRLKEFLRNGLKHYKEGRNHPAKNHVSRLSPHLHFGEISPNDVWHTAKKKMVEDRCRKDGEHFLMELGWREFSYSLLYHFPDLPRVNLQKNSMSSPGVLMTEP